MDDPSVCGGRGTINPQPETKVFVGAFTFSDAEDIIDWSDHSYDDVVALLGQRAEDEFAEDDEIIEVQVLRRHRLRAVSLPEETTPHD